MWVEVRVCREAGERLGRSRWPEPVRGCLFVGSVYRGSRALRVAELYVESPQWRRQILPCIFDPVMETWERGFVLKGYQITPRDRDRVIEYRQIWYCVPITRGHAEG